MDRMNAHLTANLTLIALLWAASLLVVWILLPGDTILKGLLSLISPFVVGYAGHRIAPRITDSTIDKMYDTSEKMYEDRH